MIVPLTGGFERKSSPFDVLSTDGCEHPAQIYNKTRGRAHDTNQTSIERHITTCLDQAKFPVVTAKCTALGVSTESGRTGMHGTEFGISRVMNKLELLE